MVKIYLSSIQQLVSTKLHVEEQFKVEENKKKKREIIIQYIEEIKYLLSVYVKSAIGEICILG